MYWFFVFHLSCVFNSIFDYSENAYYYHAILNVALGATSFVLVIDEKTVIKHFSFKNFTAIVCELLSLII